MQDRASTSPRSERDWCSALGRVATAASSSLEPGEVLSRGLEALREVFGLPCGEAYRATPEGLKLEKLLDCHADCPLAREASALAEEGARSGQPVWRGGLAAVPVRSRDRVQGVYVLNLPTPREARESHFLTLVAHLVGLALDHADLLGSLEARDAQRTQLLHRLLFAHEEERRRIGRELHDEVGSLLTSALLVLQLGEAHPEYLSEARQAVVRAMEEVRRLSRELRPAVLEDLGLQRALERYAQEFAQRTGLEVQASLDLPALEEAHQIALFRIVQEALTNVARHAGASRVRVRLERHGAAIEGEVEDDGRGFEPRFSRDSVGLVGMRERAEQLGGQLGVDSAPGTGTRVRFRVPLAG